jgi:hypothetical protein
MSIGILSCVWQRPERLDLSLGWLSSQTNRDWHLYLINNNYELRGFITDVVGGYSLPITIIHNAENRGPFARLEVAHEYAEEHSHFMTLDDDLNFGPGLLESWHKQKSDEVRGWNGFRFKVGYWDRDEVAPGEECDYLWGSNLLFPAGVAADDRITDLDRKYWQCDDLYLCYVANHLLGVTLRKADIDVSVNRDGKDTFKDHRSTKWLFLEELRGRGWEV